MWGAASAEGLGILPQGGAHEVHLVVSGMSSVKLVFVMSHHHHQLDPIRSMEYEWLFVAPKIFNCK